MGNFLLLLIGIIAIQDVSGKYFGGVDSDNIMRNLVAYNSQKVKRSHEQFHLSDHIAESIYYSPYRSMDPEQQPATNASNVVTSSVIVNEVDFRDNVRNKRGDPTFRGNPKTKQEVWHKNFNFTTLRFAQSTSLVNLLNKIISRYMSSCIPVILYDMYVQNSEGFIIQRLLEEFPTTYMHGSINSNYTLDDRTLLEPPDSKCRSYILFLSDALMTRQVIGSQIDNKVIVVPRSTQWKLQEFLSSPLSRDIINLLVIGESYSADKTKENPYVLYTHQLYVDGLGSNRPLLLTSWMKGRLSRPHIDLFPKKLTTGFSGHRFTVGAADQPPFVFKIIKTDGVGNINIQWDGLEYRILQVLGKMYNFSIDVTEAKNVRALGAGDSVGIGISKKHYDIGLAGMYVTTERNTGMEMSISHSTDCAAFVTLASKALPRYRAILGPFQWPVWVLLTFTYLLAVLPLAYSDRLSLRYLIDQPGQLENMFWYVFGTFTNSLTFSGELSWSKSKKTSTRLLIGWYWVFTIIITACYTGSIIAFVTLPVFPETTDSVDQLNSGFFRIGTLDRGGWERWFLNSSQKSTAKLIRKLEFVVDIEEGINNVTHAFIWPYAFIGSRKQLEFVIATNYSNDQLGKRSVLHISNECFALFGTSIAFQEESVYRNILNDGILAMQQSGLIDKLMSDVKWDRLRSPTGKYLQVSPGKTLRIVTQAERGLTLVDTEGMFLLLGIGFVIGGGVLISEWVGGITNKCRQILKTRKEDKVAAADKAEQERVYDEIHHHDHDEDDNGAGHDGFDGGQESHETHHMESISIVSSEPFQLSSPKTSKTINETFDTTENVTTSAASDDIIELDSERSISPSSESILHATHNRSGSVCVSSLNRQVLQDLYHGPKRRHPNMVMVNGKIMSEEDAIKYSSEMKLNEEIERQSSGSSTVSKAFDYLKEEDLTEEEIDDIEDQPQINENATCEVEINHDPEIRDIEESFGEKIVIDDHMQDQENPPSLIC